MIDQRLVFGRSGQAAKQAVERLLDRVLEIVNTTALFRFFPNVKVFAVSQRFAGKTTSKYVNA